MHRRYRELLTPILGSIVYASEEAEPEVIGDNPDPDLCVLVDPLDTSELAVRGLLGYTHVMVYSRAAAQPVIAVVGDIFHHLQLYVGARDEHGSQAAGAAGQVNRSGGSCVLGSKLWKEVTYASVEGTGAGGSVVDTRGSRHRNRICHE